MTGHLEAYRALCAAKRPEPFAAGIRRTPELNHTLRDHQRAGVEFALRAGRSALFYDTGLGKTRMMLDWGRCVVEHTNEGDTVLSPFMGIGSEGFQSVKMGRRFIGTELKESYFKQAVKYLREAEKAEGDLFVRVA